MGTSNNPKVSVGLPVYNGAKTIGETIDSILRQSHSDFELLISDNASTDKTENICREYAEKDKRISYQRLDHNCGGLSNFNRVAQLATREYFMWAAADDSFEPEYIKRCMTTLENNKEAVCCYTATRLLTDEGRITSIYRDNFTLKDSSPRRRVEVFLRNIDLCNMLHGLMRISALRKTDLLRSDTQISDVLFLAQMALEGKIIQLEETLFNRRRAERPAESMEQRAARLERWIFGNKPHGPRRFPFIQLIKKLSDCINQSEIDPKSKAEMLIIIPQVLGQRYGQMIGFEVSRSINLALQGIFELPWGADPKDRKIPEAAQEHYQAAAFVHDLEEALSIFSDFKGIHIAKAIALLRMGRENEARLAAYGEYKKRPDFAPAKELCRQMGMLDDKGEVVFKLVE